MRLMPIIWVCTTPWGAYVSPHRQPPLNII